MTTATPPSPSLHDDEVDESTLRDDERRTRPGRSRSRWWRLGYPMALVVLVIAIPILVFVGLRVILDSNDGQLVSRVTDPTAPGYEALVKVTPTQVVVGVDDTGSLNSITLLALTSEGAGGVMTVPVATQIPFDTGPLSLGYIHDNIGMDAFREQLGNLLDVSVADLQTMTSADWASYVAPVAPLAIDSPDPVVDARGAVIFPKGSIELTADQVSTYLSGRGVRESDLNRMVRIQAFWRAWVEAVGTAGPSAMPVPTDVGLGRFLVTLATDDVRYETLPVRAAGQSATGVELFSIDGAAVPGAIAGIVPFPEGPLGVRPRLRVLDGTGQLDNGVQAAISLAAAGGQIDVVGNARSFDTPTTQIVYYDEAMENAARSMRDALGVGEVVQSDQTNSATDLTVVLGDDYLAVVGSSSPAVQPDTQGANGG